MRVVFVVSIGHFWETVGEPIFRNERNETGQSPVRQVAARIERLLVTEGFDARVQVVEPVE